MSDIPDSAATFRILQAIGLGKTRFSEIKAWARVTSERILQRLIAVGLIERCVPANEDADRSKRSIYRILDPYFRFLSFRLAHPGEIDRGLGAQIIRNSVLPHFEQYMGLIFEDIAHSYVRAQAAGDGTLSASANGGRPPASTRSTYWARRTSRTSPSRAA